MHIKTYLMLTTDSLTHVHSAQDIRRCTTIWEYHNKLCKVYWKRQFYNFCIHQEVDEIQNLLKYSYIRNGVVYSPTDISRYIENSSNPNLKLNDNNDLVTIKDICKGDKLTLDFNMSYDLNSFHYWDLPSDIERDNLLQILKQKLFVPGRPQTCLSL